MERGRGREGSRQERRREGGRESEREEEKVGGGVDEPSESRYIHIRLESVGQTTLSVMVSLSTWPNLDSPR